MPGLQDLAVRLAEILDIPQSEALNLTRRLIPVLTLESIVGIPTTRVPGIVGAPAMGTADVAASVGNLSHVGIFNPVDSGVTLFVERATFSTPAASTIAIRSRDVALPTLVTTKGWRDRRRRGDAVGEMRTEARATGPGTTLFLSDIQAVIPETIEFNEIILAEGQGLHGALSATNQALRANWFWREV